MQSTSASRWTSLLDVGYRRCGRWQLCRSTRSAHPEWDDLDQTIAALLSADEPGQCGAVARQPADFDPRTSRSSSVSMSASTIRSAASAAATLPLALGFSRTVRKFDKLKRPVRTALVQSFCVSARAGGERGQSRCGSTGLLKALDAQRGRILLSSFLELEVDHVTGVPKTSVAGIAAVAGGWSATGFRGDRDRRSKRSCTMNTRTVCHICLWRCSRWLRFAASLRIGHIEVDARCRRPSTRSALRRWYRWGTRSSPAPIYNRLIAGGSFHGELRQSLTPV